MDPKADLTFKKVFGEHRDLVVSFLNALLPFDSPEEEIKEVLEYCQFVVEMQMMWTSAFKQRVLFNASKAYVSQLETGGEYELLQPVYSLNIVNDVYCDSKSYYHDYRIVAIEETDEVIDGLRFIFIELPKFNPQTYSDRKMQVLWLRFLTEINAKTREAPKELMAVPVIRKAVKQLEEGAFTDQQLLLYDRFWDMVSTSRTLINGAVRDARRKALEEGIAQGAEQERARIACSMKQKGMPVESVSELTGLTVGEVSAL